MFEKYFGLILLFIAAVVAQQEPIVLVHGLAGDTWNWGYEQELKDEGFTVFNLAVGKFTSAHDRACEIYAQLKGTRVDFGVCHAAEFGHNRFGNDFTGQALFPQWDENNKIHLIGHSLGAPTITLLEKLLEEGTDCPEDDGPMFQGGQSIIKSISTFSGVHGGTTLVDTLGNGGFLDFVEALVFFFAGVLDNSLLDFIYEIDFGHWNLERQPFENIFAFMKRVRESGVLDESNKDISTYDLSTQGAREIAAFGELAYPDTFYYSFASERTNPFRNCFLFWCSDEFQIPDLFMLIFFQPFAADIGSLNTPAEDRENDGLVNLANQLCPIVTPADRDNCEEFDGDWQPGVWFFQKLDSFDHLQTVFRNLVEDVTGLGNSPKELYIEHARRLKAISSGQSSVILNEALLQNENESPVPIRRFEFDEDVKTFTNGEVVFLISLVLALNIIVLGLAWVRSKRKRRRRSPKLPKDNGFVTSETGHKISILETGV